MEFRSDDGGLDVPRVREKGLPEVRGALPSAMLEDDILARLVAEEHVRKEALRSTPSKVASHNEDFSKRLAARKREGRHAKDMSVAGMGVANLIDEVVGIQYHTHGTDEYQRSALRARETVGTLQTKLRQTRAWDPAWKDSLEALAPKTPQRPAGSTPSGRPSSAGKPAAQQRMAGPSKQKPRNGTIFNEAREAQREILRKRKQATLPT